MNEEQIRFLCETLGLERILEQNDIEQEYVMELLIEHGLIDPDEYFFEDVDVDD